MLSEPCEFDVVIIGGGHAGAEAAWAAANALRAEGGRVALVTMDPTSIGRMSCNPAIGGLGKGQMVREIDALGGLMGLAADATGIQFRVLNSSKGPAVRGPRCQSDKHAYAIEVQRLLGTRENLTIVKGMVEDFLVEAGRCVGVRLADRLIAARAVVLTTGTFMRGLMHCGEKQTAGGRVGEKPAEGISGTLRRLGFELGRLKTGTPPRLRRGSIDIAALEHQPGDAVPIPFSDCSDAQRFPVLEQVACWITTTNASIHDLIRANLDRAPMYNGQIETAGPRYCPSIEDKVVRFADKSAHHVFLEPESLTTEEVYCNGISTSLPEDVQRAMVHAMPGCERAEILRYGYAVEYDMVWPHQIDVTGATKHLPGLFLAGQINGTTGYEEAAGQGLMAGLNAARLAQGLDPVRLGRDEAYIGVMMDDLVTTVPREPYRMFTSRAEHRLLLRSDNAPERLTTKGRDWQLVEEDRWAIFQKRQQVISDLADQLHQQREESLRISLAEWARRPEADEQILAQRLGIGDVGLERRALSAVLSTIKYAGFVDRHEAQRQRVARMESATLPTSMDFDHVAGLRTEARHVLRKFKPATLGQAGRLAGITPADVTVLAIAMDRKR